MYPYTAAQFYQYFDFGIVLLTKDIQSDEQYNAMQDAQEHSLSAMEVGLSLITAQPAMQYPSIPLPQR